MNLRRVVFQAIADPTRRAILLLVAKQSLTDLPFQTFTATYRMRVTPAKSNRKFLEFEWLTDNTSKLNICTIYETLAQRNQVLQLPFAQGINIAHNRFYKTL